EEGMTRVLSAGFAESAHQVPVHEEAPEEGDGAGTPGGYGHVRTDGTPSDGEGSAADGGSSGE
ncbi:hypothetical protein EXE42_18305, partial [Halorubrum sp. SP3]